jgi:ABC-type Fe3+-hydroxamate transport system substrate-binding protein
MRPLLLWLTTCLTLSAAGHRIASYSPGATQTLLDLGCAEEIVMATRWCPLPKDHPAARDADVFLPDLERLLKAKPDLVILPRMANPLWAEKCKKAGLRTIILHPEARDSIRRDVTLLGEATGRTDAAKAFEFQMLAGSAAPRIKTVLVVWDGVMAGPDSYLDEPLARAALGAGLSKGAWVKFDWELLAAAKPDAVIWIQNSETNGPLEAYPEKIAEMGRIPAIKDLACVKKGHVYQAKSGSNWLPGSGLQRILPDLLKLHSELTR